MEPGAYSITFPAFIGIVLASVGSGVWFFIQRQLKKSDEESNFAAIKIADGFKEQGQRIGGLSETVQRLELNLANKIGREEIDKFYDKIDELKREVKEDSRELKQEILAAIGHKGN
jgi:hypothetical protein